MFKIIKASDGTVLALTEDVTYIKKADNGWKPNPPSRMLMLSTWIRSTA